MMTPFESVGTIIEGDSTAPPLQLLYNPETNMNFSLINE